MIIRKLLSGLKKPEPEIAVLMVCMGTIRRPGARAVGVRDLHRIAQTDAAADASS